MNLKVAKSIGFRSCQYINNAFKTFQRLRKRMRVITSLTVTNENMCRSLQLKKKNFPQEALFLFSFVQYKENMF